MPNPSKFLLMGVTQGGVLGPLKRNARKSVVFSAEKITVFDDKSTSFYLNLKSYECCLSNDPNYKDL